MRALKAAAAAVLLALLLVAPPWLLIRLIGNPWPAEGVALDAPLTDDAVVGILVGFLWLLWAQFAICVAAEVAAALTNDRVPSRVPMAFGFQQHLARRLVSGIVIATVATPLLGSGGAAAYPQPVPLVASSPESSQHRLSYDAERSADIPRDTSGRPTTHESAEVQVAAHQRVDKGMVTVMRLDTLWSIAERVLGDGERWTEIAQLNEGRVMSDGSTFVSVDHIRPGWQLTVPVTPGTTSLREPRVEVRTGDSLSLIAEQELGSAADWPEVYDLNRKKIGPEPDLIYPGQVLQLPMARHPSHTTMPDPTPPTTTPGGHGDDHRTQTTPTRHSGSEQAGDGTEHRDPGEASPGPAEQSSSRNGQSEGQASRSEETSSDISPVRVLLATAVCFAAGSLALLLANRRRQFRNRRPGRTVHDVPPQLKKHERAVHEAGTASEPTARFVDLALRQLAAEARRTGAPLPQVGLAVLEADRLTLLFIEPAATKAPTPWTGTPDCRLWSLPRTVELDDGLLDQPAPYPALVTFAQDASGRTWLLDLESLGDVTIGGEGSQAEDLARFIVAELSVNAWAEGVEVLLTDALAIELVDLNPARVRRCDRGTAARRSNAVSENDDQPPGRLLDRRRDDDATDSTSPLVLVCGALEEVVDDIAVSPRAGVVAIRAANQVSGSSENMTLLLGRDGHVRLSGFADELVPFGLPAKVGGEMARLMAVTRVAADDPMPPSTSGTGVAQLTTADGAIRPELTTARDPQGDEASLLPDSDEEYLDQTATTETDIAAIAPAVANDVRRQLEALDPGLDADIHDWFDAESTRPKVQVLGPVDVTAMAGDREHVANIGGTVEFIVYLACHEHGVTKDRAAEDLGWSGSTVQNRARDARRVLGQRPEGSEWLPDAAKSESAKRRGVATYQLNSDVLVDAELFRRLRARASSRAADGLEDLVVGLSLVKGEPFDQLRRGGYGWLLEGDRLDHHMCASIADVAHLVFDRALVDSDVELARTACRIGMIVNPYSDVARLDLAVLAEAEGRSPDEVVRQGVVDRVDEDLTARTEEVLRRRGWLAI